MVDMKEKGFTLIELIVVMAIITILFIIAIGAGNSVKNSINDDISYSTPNVESIPPIHIDNSRRSYNTVKMQRHSDGSLWACRESYTCYEVIQ